MAIAYRFKKPWSVTWFDFLGNLGSSDEDERRLKCGFRKRAKEFCKAFPAYKVKTDGDSIVFYPVKMADLLVPPKLLDRQGAKAVPLPFEAEASQSSFEDKPKRGRGRPKKEKLVSQPKTEAEIERKETQDNFHFWFNQACGEEDFEKLVDTLVSEGKSEEEARVYAVAKYKENTLENVKHLKR